MRAMWLVLAVTGFLTLSCGKVPFDTVRGAAGALDATFSGTGYVITSFAEIGAAARAVAVLSDDRIVAAGLATVDGKAQVGLARYLPDGTLDTTFGSSGKTTSTADATRANNAIGLAVATDGKLVTAGLIGSGSASNFLVSRFNADGSADTGFGTNGHTELTVGDSTALARSVAIQSDGKIVAVGEAFVNATGFRDIALVRLNTDGSPDSSFGTSGRLTLNTGAGSSRASAVAVQADDKIILAGEALFTSDSLTANDFVVLRRNADGTADTTFGTNGLAVSHFSNFSDNAFAVKIQPDGKILTAGEAFPFDGNLPHFAMARFNADGSADTAFGTLGRQVTSAGTLTSRANAVALQADGKILLGGTAFVSKAGTVDFAVLRYGMDGNPDVSFGDSGKVTTRFSPTFSDSLNGLALQSDGRIIAVGSGYTAESTDINDSRFTIVRYWP